MRDLSLESSFGIATPVTTTQEEQAFDHFIAVLLVRLGRFATGWVMIMTVLFWPTDLAAFRRLPEALPAFTALRCALLASSFGCMLAMQRTDLIPPRRELAFAAPWMLACGILAACLARLGGLETPWFHFTYLCVALTIFFPVRLPRRILYVGLVALALVVGALAARPSLPHSPFFITTLGFLMFVAIGSVAFGQLLFLLTRSNYFQQRALQGSATELSRQVAEQTRELRQLTTHLANALELERARISREVHDELGQELTAMRYELGFAQQRFERDPASIRGNLANLENILSRTARSTRAIVTDLRPRILDDLGLCAAAEWLVGRTIERTELPCSLRIDGTLPDELADEVGLAAFRVLQESLTNATRHAAATRIDVVMELTDAAIALTVRDDGRGMSTPSERSEGMGIVGMRERVRALGGELHIESASGRGTEVRCRLPLRSGSRP